MAERLFRPDSTLNGVDVASTVVCNPETMRFPLALQRANQRWSLAKGEIDARDIGVESDGLMTVELNAALREIYEELGLEQSDIRYILPLGDAERFSQGRQTLQRVRYHLGITDHSLEGLSPQADDITEVGVFGAEDALERLLNPKDREVFQYALATLAMRDVHLGDNDAS